MNNPYFRSSANESSSLKNLKKKKQQSSSVGGYFRSSSSRSQDSDSSGSGSHYTFEDLPTEDDAISVASQGSAASMRSSLSNAANLLKKTAAMPVVLAAKTTKSVARKGYKAGAAVVHGTSQAVFSAGNAVGQGGKAIVGGTTAVVVGGSKAIVGGTTAVVVGGSKAIVGGTTAVVKGSSKVIVGGTTAVVKGGSKVIVGGTSAIVGGTTAVTRKTVRGLQHGASHMRPGRRAFRRNSQKDKSQNQWDIDMATLDEILQPGSATYQALSASQRKLMQNVKKMLLRQGTQLSSTVSGTGDRQAAAFLPMDLVQMEKKQQKKLRRPSNASSIGTASLLHQETASVYSEASYLLQEYGGVKNPMALLSANQSNEFDAEEDLLDLTNTSDLSMSVKLEDSFLLPDMPHDSVTESGSEAFDSTRASMEMSAIDENATASVAKAKITSSDADKPTVAPKKVPKKTVAPPPPVTDTMRSTDMHRKGFDYTTFLPVEFEQLEGVKMHTVYNMLCWDELGNWDYDVFDLDRISGENALLFMGWAILAAPYAQCAMAQACGCVTDNHVFTGYPFMDKLNIPPQKLIAYLRAIQQDYHAENPYHNSVHAADVLQTVHAMIQMALRTGTDESNGENETKAGFFVYTPPTFLQLFSILLAAVVHDVDHPGKNNAFHVKLKTELAVVYHDKSILENWHIAYAFARMLGLDLMNRASMTKEVTTRTNHQDLDCNLLCNASADDFAAIRNMMIEAILQTDMTKHFALVTDLKNMRLLIDEEEESSTGCSDQDADRAWNLLMFMLHQADISGQAKADPLFLNWTDRCHKEFFAQGDEEALLEMSPISPYCDRHTTNVAVAQTGFVEFVIQPSYKVLGEYIPQIQEVVLPIIEENLDFWYDASGKPRKTDESKEDKDSI